MHVYDVQWIVFTLKRPNYRGYMTRAELQKEAQPFCEASFTMVITVFNYVPITNLLQQAR